MFLALTIQVVRDVRFCRWVSSSRRHEASWCFDLEYLTVKITAVRSSETSETAYPTTWIFGNAALRTSDVKFSLQCCFCTQGRAVYNKRTKYKHRFFFNTRVPCILQTWRFRELTAL